MGNDGHLLREFHQPVLDFHGLPGDSAAAGHVLVAVTDRDVAAVG
jgi:hypothetical protein